MLWLPQNNYLFCLNLCKCINCPYYLLIWKNLNTVFIQNRVGKIWKQLFAQSNPCLNKGSFKRSLTHWTLSAEWTAQAFHRASGLKLRFLERVGVRQRGLWRTRGCIWTGLKDKWKGEIQMCNEGRERHKWFCIQETKACDKQQVDV